jgi:DNA-binding response OmpR family regulator
MATVVVIEDDQHIREALTRALADAGHAVRAASTGAQALTAIVEWRPDVVVLDLGLPDIDGRDVLAMLRGISSVPVIVATARDDEAEIVELLDAGADDYVIKPYRTAQMEARIRAVLRRVSEQGSSAQIAIGDLVIDETLRSVTLEGAPLELTRLEFDALAFLARRSPEIVSRRELMAEVWRQPYGGGEKTVDVHLSWLRRKLGESAAEPRYLHTIRGVGVRLQAPGDR